LPRVSGSTVDLSKVKYYDRVKEVLDLTVEQERALSTNGF
jgi:hypothetical protein